MSDDMGPQFFELIKSVWREIFGVEANFTLAQFIERYASDIPLPEKRTCSLTGADVYMQRPTDKVVSRDEMKRQQSEKSLVLEPEPIKSMADVLSKFDRINYYTGDYVRNSTNVFQSDQIYSSSNVYRSASVFTSKYVGLSYGVSDSEMAFACKDNKQLSYCIRAFESGQLTNCYEAYNAGKSSNSMFIHDCYDLRDCMFCFHIVSAQYCIANMQYTREEYERIRTIVVEWVMQGNMLKR
jgi:hypothetical protein